MKIQNSQPISSKNLRSSKRSSNDGAFDKILAAEINPAQAVAEKQPRESQHPMKEAWQTLEASVSLLDKAMLALEHGNNPSAQLMQDIEQLRGQLRQQVTSGRSADELKQADTLLAVEAERIRSMQS